MKTCRHCKKSKPEKEYSPNKRNPDGLNSACAQCCQEYKEKTAAKKSGSPAGDQAKTRVNVRAKGKVKAYQAIAEKKLDLDHPNYKGESASAHHVRRKGSMGSTKREIAQQVNQDLEAKAVEFLQPIQVGNLNKLPRDKRFKEFTGALHLAADTYKATYGIFPRTVYQYRDRFFLQEPPAVEMVIIQKEKKNERQAKKNR
jgi:hypothetical protein